jgi:hypothetical protein
MKKLKQKRQETESNALAISTFMSTEGNRLLWSHLQVRVTVLKLSWMHLPFMKAL